MSYELSLEHRIWASAHALARMEELAIDYQSVIDAIVRPTLSWPAHSRRVHRARGAVIVVLDESSRTVITVKLKSRTPYVHGVHSLHNLPGEAAA